MEDANVAFEVILTDFVETRAVVTLDEVFFWSSLLGFITAVLLQVVFILILWIWTESQSL